MTRKERNQILKWAKSLSDEELIKEYHKSLNDCCGSLCDEMYERGYDMVDIEYQAELENDYAKTHDLISKVCNERNIDPWKVFDEK